MSTSLLTKIAVARFGAGFGGYALYETVVQTVGLRGECIVDIVGADLQVRSNNKMDHFSKPDPTIVLCRRLACVDVTQSPLPTTYSMYY